jgi:GNAT superfamily N-acetyltransferase
MIAVTKRSTEEVVRARKTRGVVAVTDGEEYRPAELGLATVDDHAELFAAYSEIVRSKEGFPHASPLSREDFDDYWIAHSSAVWIARAGGKLVGAYYLKPNFVGKAAHIANAGYFVVESHRRKGLGRAMVEHSLPEARRLGFDALQFNLVFASNPARALYRQLGFMEVGRIPAAVDGEDAIIYWRSLEEGTL